jgi:hypothetical protein
MTGTVVFSVPRGVNVKMDTPGIVPPGTYQILSQKDQKVIGTVTLLRQGVNWCRFNWNPKTDPMPVAQPGDLLRPVSG